MKFAQGKTIGAGERVQITPFKENADEVQLEIVIGDKEFIVEFCDDEARELREAIKLAQEGAQ